MSENISGNMCENMSENISEKEMSCCGHTEGHNHGIEQVGMHMPPQEELDDLAELFKVFGDVTRLRILFVLFESELCVCDLANSLGMTQSAISHQLKTLKQSKLVKSRREGKSMFYSLADSHVSTMIAQGLEHIKE